MRGHVTRCVQRLHQIGSKLRGRSGGRSLTCVDLPSPAWSHQVPQRRGAMAVELSEEQIAHLEAAVACYEKLKLESHEQPVRSQPDASSSAGPVLYSDWKNVAVARRNEKIEQDRKRSLKAMRESPLSNEECRWLLQLGSGRFSVSALTRAKDNALRVLQGKPLLDLVKAAAKMLEEFAEARSPSSTAMEPEAAQGEDVPRAPTGDPPGPRAPTGPPPPPPPPPPSPVPPLPPGSSLPPQFEGVYTLARAATVHERVCAQEMANKFEELAKKFDGPELRQRFLVGYLGSGYDITRIRKPVSRLGAVRMSLLSDRFHRFLGKTEAHFDHRTRKWILYGDPGNAVYRETLLHMCPGQNRAAWEEVRAGDVLEACLGLAWVCIDKQPVLHMTPHAAARLDALRVEIEQVAQDQLEEWFQNPPAADRARVQEFFACVEMRDAFTHVKNQHCVRCRKKILKRTYVTGSDAWSALEAHWENAEQPCGP